MINSDAYMNVTENVRSRAGNVLAICANASASAPAAKIRTARSATALDSNITI